MMFLVEQTSVPSGSLPIGELRDHLLLGSGFSTDGAQDAVLEQYLRSAIAAIEARTGKVLLEKQFSWTLTAWQDRYSQRLPVAPVTAIDALNMMDRAGNATAIATGGQAELVFMAGYGPLWADVPPSLRQAVLILAAHYYEHRAGEREFPFGIQGLIERFRNLRLRGGRAS